MDNFGINRAALLSSYQDIVDGINKKKKQDSLGQESLFGENPESGETKKTTATIDDFSSHEKLAFEKEYLGFYLTSHPQMDNLLTLRSQTTHSLDVLEEETEGQSVKVGGIIEAMRKIFTKKTGAEMAFITIGDENGKTIECVVFPKVYERHRSLINKDSLILMEGRIDTKNERPIIIAERISTI